MKGFTATLGTKRRYNFALVLGSILVAFMIFLAVFGPILAPRDPGAGEFINTTHEGDFLITPYPPMTVPGFPLGSDLGGRDILSRLMWAFRPTLIMAAIIAMTRLVIGTTAGFLEGWYSGRRIGDLINAFTEMTASLPLLLIAILILYVIGLERGLVGFVLALSLTGWTNTAQFMAERVRVLRQEPYVEAARALGAGDIHTVIKHVLPQVANLLPVMLSFEMGATLIVVAELGYLEFFVAGGSLLNVAGTDEFVTVAGQPELAQMLSDAWGVMLLMPWAALWSGLSFFVAIFSFMMMGEGLKQHLLESMGVRVPRMPMRRWAGLGGKRVRQETAPSTTQLPQSSL